jgi:parallel beta-helix repeat protein
MHAIRVLGIALIFLGGLLAVPSQARAAETFHTCAGFIDSLPATISTQGVWCLRHDLSTNIASGAAVTIATNNVTIDCNDFKLGGLAAGDASQAQGIRADGRQNATVRHCNVRGFFYGIDLRGGGAGHLVEDNRLDNNLFIGIYVDGDNNLVQRNRVFETGGAPNNGFSYGIEAAANIFDNTVAGVVATATNRNSTGIYATGAGTEVGRNRVRGLEYAGSGEAVGIEVTVPWVNVDGNRVWVGGDGYGIRSIGASLTICGNNTVVTFPPYIATLISGCHDSGGNTYQ